MEVPRRIPGNIFHDIDHEHHPFTRPQQDDPMNQAAAPPVSSFQQQSGTQELSCNMPSCQPSWTTS